MAALAEAQAPPRKAEVRPAGMSDLDVAEVVYLQGILELLPLLADVAHADLLVFGRDGDRMTVVAHAAPNPVISLYPTNQAGLTYARREHESVSRVLYGGRERHSVSGVLVWGAPSLQEVLPIRGPEGRVLAAVSCNRNLVEHERLQHREPPFRAMVYRVLMQGLNGRLAAPSPLGRLTENDGVLIVDTRGIIRYMNSVAENQYRRLGYVDSLLGEQISELDTHEYICFRSIERGECLEQRIEEEDQVWIKRAIPLFPVRDERHFKRFRRPDPCPAGAVMFIQDITDEVRREQELKIKNAMIQEVHHRVKNNLQTVAFLLRMQASRASVAEAQEVLYQTVGRIQSIAVVHEFLSRGDGSDIDILDVCTRIAGEVSASASDDQKRISINVSGGTFYLPAQQATSCALVMNELVQNAVEHGFGARSAGEIDISFGETDASVIIEIADDGVGLPAGFDPAASSSLGLRIIQTLIKDDLRGQLVLANRESGAVATVSIPKSLCRPAGSATVGLFGEPRVEATSLGDVTLAR
jgi:two-component system, sensor histidine kinase PdtaS